MGPDTTSISTSAKQRRRCGNKVRSGCANCKQRHLKCDEAKPACKRCKHSLFTCEYLAPEKRRNSPVTKACNTKPPVPLLPRRPKVGSRLTSTPLRPELSPIQGLFHDDKEREYFDFFWDQLTYQLTCMTSYCNPDFWSRYIFRESVGSACVRQSLIAHGALADPLHEQCQPFQDERSRSAIVHHIRAVSMFQALFSAQRTETRPMTILVLTLMISAFELLQGNLAMGYKLLNGGIVLLKESAKRSPEGWHPKVVAMSKDRKGIRESLPKCFVMKPYDQSVQLDLKSGIIGLLDIGDEICVD